MKLDAALDDMEDGVVTDAEYADQETEIEDMQSLLDDDYMDADSLDTDMEAAYRDFHDNKGFDGVPVGDYSQGQLESIVEDEVGLDLSEEGFHVEDEFGNDRIGNDLPSSGRLDDFDVDELSNEAPESTVDEAEPIDYGFDVARYQKEGTNGAPEGGNVDVVIPDAGKVI